MALSGSLAIGSPAIGSLAIGSLAILPSTQEMVILLIVGLLLFGRRLPEVGKQVGKVIVQLRQGMQKLKDEIDLHEDIRDVRATVDDVRDDFSHSIELPDAPRVLADPHRALRDLTDEALSSPGPDEAEPVEPAGESLFVREASSSADGGGDADPGPKPAQDSDSGAGAGKGSGAEKGPGQGPSD